MQTHTRQPAKKTWIAPRLAVHGSIVDITRAKTFGFSDGVIFDPDAAGPSQGVPIGEWS